MVQDLLNVVEGEATKDDETTVEPDVLGPHEGAGGGGGKDHGGETGESDDGDTSEEGTADVKVLLLLGGGADKGDAAHETDRVETSAGEDGGVEEHERRQKSGLGDVEGGPEGVLGDVAEQIISRLDVMEYAEKDSLLRRAHARSHHGTNRSNETDTEDQPGVCRHQAVGPAVGVKSARGDTDDADTQAGVEEGVIQVGSLVRGHAAILSCFAVEDQVDL